MAFLIGINTMSAPIQDNIPEFARGSTFEAVMTLPQSVAENYFSSWQPLSQIRREGNLTSEGLIDDLTLAWLGPREFILSSNDTDEWPLGIAEFDVLFSSNQGRRIRTKTLRVLIKAGPTQD
jgi:hypothetical protein